MKKNGSRATGLVIVVLLAVIGLSDHHQEENQHLLGARRCTWGPTFWCQNITNAKYCHAVRHCIQTAWLHRDVPTDNDSICQICKDMVTQARDQLRSNETLEELKQVFEGSCNLIPVKVVRKECCKLADNFIPELVETLSSEMNPDQVCTVAGLCNNVFIDKLLMKYYSGALEGTLKEDDDGIVLTQKDSTTSTPTAAAAPVVDQKHVEDHSTKKHLLTCTNCYSLSKLMTQKFIAKNHDDVLENMLHMCGQLSTFTDACSSIVLTYFNDIYDYVEALLKENGTCHLAGVCASKYHRHSDDPKEEDEQAIDLLKYGKDDIPCELCEQLVQHLRDLLVANTTEDEFKQVLEGLCNQTKGFRDECLSIVDQYYDVIYKNLVEQLNPNGACLMIGICPKTLKDSALFNREIMPMVPALPPAQIKVTIEPKKRPLLGVHEPKFTQEEIQAMTLPIDKLMGASNPTLLVENGELCTLCEYILHFIQETLATPAEAEQIKETITGVCHKLPKSVMAECNNFVDQYGDAVIALLIQGLDPRAVCPKMQMCPKSHRKYQDDVEVFAPHEVATDTETDKPTCPLCLFAVEQAQIKIKDDKSKKNIENVLHSLCDHLPEQLKVECNDFVQTYFGELVDKLISDFKPQEICTDLKLCPKKTKNFYDELAMELDENIDSNKVVKDIDPFSVELSFHVNKDGSSPNCILCEEMIKIAEKRIHKRTSKADIKKALESSCEKLRTNLRPKCHKYVDEYGDKIADLLIKEMEPKVICVELGLCLFSDQEDLEIDEALKYDVIAMPNNVRLEGTDDEEFFHAIDHQDDTIQIHGLLQDPPSCVLCEFVMTKVEMELKNKTDREHIKQAIENVCHRMPKTITKSCTKFIEQYAETLMDFLTNVPPSEVCKAMKLCLDGMQLDEGFITNEIIECGVCHGTTMALLPFLKEHKNHAEISTNDMLEVACENLPAKYFEMCRQLINVYGKSIINLSERNDELNICAEIGKCFHNERSSLAFARITA